MHYHKTLGFDVLGWVQLLAGVLTLFLRLWLGKTVDK